MSAALALKFREMVPDDADAVELVEKACFAIPWSRESFWREAANENTSYTLALDGDKVIGYAGCWISLRKPRSRMWPSCPSTGAAEPARSSWLRPSGLSRRVVSRP